MIRGKVNLCNLNKIPSLLVENNKIDNKQIILTDFKVVSDKSPTCR